MSERIDQFCENLRVRLTGIENDMQGLRAKIDAKARTAEQDVRNELEGVKKRMEQDRTKVAAAQANIKKWLEECKTTTNEKIAEWKAKSEKAKLQSRANMAEQYAVAAAVVALAAVNEAQQASLEAWLARKDAESGRQGSERTQCRGQDQSLGRRAECFLPCRPGADRAADSAGQGRGPAPVDPERRVQSRT